MSLPHPRLVPHEGEPGDYWVRRAEAWDLVGPPWRPSIRDLELYRVLGEPWPSSGLLLLGVTPELVTLVQELRLPLLAVDRSPCMIQRLWTDRPSHQVLRAEWTALPLPAGSVDTALGDGFIAPLDPAQTLPRVAAELHRVLRPRGVVVTRVFVRPELPEDPELIFHEVKTGALRDVEVFRMRLAAALHGPGGQGVLLSELWRAWNRVMPQAGPLPQGWAPGALRVLEAYRDISARLYFPTPAELPGLLSPAFQLEHRLPSPVAPQGFCQVMRYRRVG